MYAASTHCDTFTYMTGSYAHVVRGPVTVTHSIRLFEPRWHLDPHCKGLEKTPEEARGTSEFPGALDLGLSEHGRPCRMCSLERVLRSVLRPGRSRSAPKTMVTFNSQPFDDGPFPGFSQRSASGDRRLRRLCRTLGLAVVTTSHGPVGVGLVDPTGAKVLGRNVRTYHLPTGDDQVYREEERIEVFWTLIGDSADSSPDQSRVDEAWSAAGLL